MIYVYECADGHRTERIRMVAEMNDPANCETCGAPATLAISLPARAICYANDRNGGQLGPGRVRFTGPAQRSRWAKENGRTEIGNEIPALSKQMEARRAEEPKKRKMRNKAVAIKIAKAIGASGDSIQREFDGSAKWAE